MIPRPQATSKPGSSSWPSDYSSRILPVDHRVAEMWGHFNVPDPIPVIDGLLAATAQVHGLVLATRNVKDVERTGVDCLNPFEA